MAEKTAILGGVVLWKRSSGFVVANVTALFRLNLAARLLENLVRRAVELVKGNLFCLFLARKQKHNGKYRAKQGNKQPVLWSNFHVLIPLSRAYHCAADCTVMLWTVRNYNRKAFYLQKLYQGEVKGHTTGQHDYVGRKTL